MVTTKKFVRVPLYVDAAQVSETIMEELAEWAGGEIMETDERNRGVEKFIYIDVHSPMNERQKMAFAGDWVLSTDKGFKVYTNEAFKRMFEPASEVMIFGPGDDKPQMPSPEDFNADEVAMQEQAAAQKLKGSDWVERGAKAIRENATVKRVVTPNELRNLSQEQEDRES